MKLLDLDAMPTIVDIGVWQANCDTVAHQMKLKDSEKVEMDEEFSEMLKSIAERLPRKSDEFRSSAIDAHCRSSASDLEQVFRKVLKRLVDGSAQIDGTFYINSICLFAHNDEDFAQRIAQQCAQRGLVEGKWAWNMSDEYKRDLEEMIELSNELEQTFRKAKDENSARDIVEFLVCCATCFRDMEKMLQLWRSMSMEVSMDWIRLCPQLFRTVTEKFDYLTMFEVACSLDGFPLRNVFNARLFLMKSLANLFVTFGEKCSVKEDVDFGAFLIRMGYSEFLTSHWQPRTVEQAKKKCQKDVADRLARSGYLKNLGSPNNEIVRQQVDELSEILAHLPRNYIHLALRHYSYDNERTLSSLLTKEDLPLELSVLDGFDWQQAPSEFSEELPVLDFTAADEIERRRKEERREKEEMRKKKRSQPDVGLFSLAPGKETKKEESPDEMTEIRRKAEEYKKKVLASLEAVRKRDTPDMVPMQTSKTYSALESLKISNADKIAIRPTYDKYRYVTPNDDGMYDDEYDDENDVREFNVERLNPDLETSEDEEEEETEVKEASPKPPTAVPSRGGRGRGRGRGQPRETKNEGAYTGGRSRQIKERHKSDVKQRGADRKRRGMI